MSLSDYKVTTSIAVSDMAVARDFYEGKLGLSGAENPHDHSLVYACGGGTTLHVYEAPDNAGTSTATLATWNVTDVERVVDELSAKGVEFERYDDPELPTNEKGVMALPDGKVAWFMDPDGNTFALEQ